MSRRSFCAAVVRAGGGPRQIFPLLRPVAAGFCHVPCSAFRAPRVKPSNPGRGERAGAPQQVPFGCLAMYYFRGGVRVFWSDLFLVERASGSVGKMRRLLFFVASGRVSHFLLAADKAWEEVGSALRDRPLPLKTDTNSTGCLCGMLLTGEIAYGTRTAVLLHGIDLPPPK